MEIKSILRELGYNLFDSGNYFRCKPLYRDSDSNNVLSICKKTGSFVDYARNLSGNFEQLIQLTLKYDSVNEAKTWLVNKEFNNDQIKSAKPSLKMDKTWTEEDIRYLFPDYNYWNRRGISNETLKIFGGGLCHSGQLLRRYVFPIKNELGEIHGLSGRSVVNHPTKWKHLGSTKIRTYPYYINRLEIEKAGEIILVEGISDLLALQECNIKTGIVMFGIKISDVILSLLIRVNPQRIIIATNNDKNQVGYQAALDIHKKLAKFFDPIKLDIGIPFKYNDLAEILQYEGIKGINEWYEGLSI